MINVFQLHAIGAVPHALMALLHDWNQFLNIIENVGEYMQSIRLCVRPSIALELDVGLNTTV